MATIRRRGTSWQVQIRRKGTTPITRTFLRRQDAEQWARHEEVNMDRSCLPSDPRVLSSVTLKELFSRYSETVTPTKRDQSSEAYRLARLKRDPLADLSLANMSHLAVRDFRDRRLTLVCGSTVRRELGLLSHVIETARKEWNVPLETNPVSSVRLPKPSPSRDRRLEPGELERLLEGCKGGRTPLLVPVIRFAVATGLRRGELVGAQLGHLASDGRTLHIPDTKTGYSRTIPLSPEALAVLNELPKVDPRVFPSRLTL